MNAGIAITIALGLGAATAEILGGLLVARKNLVTLRVQEYLLALGAGFLLALVFTEMIPESIKVLDTGAVFYMLLGYAVIHFFEHTIVGHFHFGEETHTDVMVTRIASFSAIAGLLVHAFFDGLAISVGMQVNSHVGLLIFFAVLLHKFPEGITTASILLASHQPRRVALLGAVAVGISTMIGILSVFLLTAINPHVISAVFAFSAGTAVYVGASDLIPEVNRSGNRITPVVVFVGMMLFYFSSQWVGSLTQ